MNRLLTIFAWLLIVAIAACTTFGLWLSAMTEPLPTISNSTGVK